MKKVIGMGILTLVIKYVQFIFETFKGHLISKGLFGVIVWTKNPTKFLRISALASKKIKNFIIELC